MRTLSEIIEAAKDGNKPTHDECYYAMLALSSLHYFDSSDILEFYRQADEAKLNPVAVKFRAEESFNRNKRCLATDPQQYVGDHDPANPEQQKRRKMAKELFEKVTGEKY